MSLLRIIGIGNEDRGDDAVGLRAADALHLALPSAIVHRHQGDGAALIQLWERADRVVLIDAVVSGAEAGTIHRVNLLASPLPVGVVPASTHHFGVRDGIELARTLQMLPASLHFIGIEGKDFSPGHPLSEPVAKALETLTAAGIEPEL